MKNGHTPEKKKVRVRRIAGLAVVIAGIIVLLIYANIAQRQHQESAESNQPGYRRISAEEAKRIMDKTPEAIILDVRTEEEWRQGHIARSTLQCVTQLERRAPAVLPDKDALILVYCRRGRRSQTAANLLLSMGYKSVYDFGGLDTWSYGLVRE
jgi:rhodanese-related sulfurtransferase